MRFLVLIAVMAMAGCASAPNGAASHSTVNGMEVWNGAKPDRPYHVFATVYRTGPDTSVNYADEVRSICAEATTRGADAVIVTTEVMTVTKLSEFTGRQIMAPKVEAELIKYGN
jgi:hypothetical protein